MSNRSSPCLHIFPESCPPKLHLLRINLFQLEEDPWDLQIVDDLGDPWLATDKRSLKSILE
jgi:hypothetical protein